LTVFFEQKACKIKGDLSIIRRVIFFNLKNKPIKTCHSMISNNKKTPPNKGFNDMVTTGIEPARPSWSILYLLDYQGLERSLSYCGHLIGRF